MFVLLDGVTSLKLGGGLQHEEALGLRLTIYDLYLQFGAKAKSDRSEAAPVFSEDPAVLSAQTDFCLAS